jgi:hypothetical protein
VDGLTALRDCLTHRGGIVTDIDVNAQDPPRLRVALLRFQYQIQSENGDIELIPAEQVDTLLVKQGGTLQAKIVETEMVFPLGTTIRVTKEEVTDLLFTANTSDSSAETNWSSGPGPLDSR